MVLGLVAALVAGCGGKQADAPGKGAKAPEAAETAQQHGPSTAPITEERTFYNFEQELQGWEVPSWAESKKDYDRQKYTNNSDSNHDLLFLIFIHSRRSQSNYWNVCFRTCLFLSYNLPFARPGLPSLRKEYFLIQIIQQYQVNCCFFQ